MITVRPSTATTRSDVKGYAACPFCATVNVIPLLPDADYRVTHDTDSRAHVGRALRML